MWRGVEGRAGAYLGDGSFPLSDTPLARILQLLPYSPDTNSEVLTNYLKSVSCYVLVEINSECDTPTCTGHLLDTSELYGRLC